MNKQDTLKNTLIENLRAAGISNPSELENVLFAYDLAKAAHEGIFRDGGDPYITHPVGGCILMARDYGIKNPNLYASFLLHDTGEDTAIFGDRESLSWDTFKRILLKRVGRIFGAEIANITLRLTKPAVDGIDFKDKGGVMKYYLANLEGAGPARDFAVFGKMIDRLHNLRSLPTEDRQKIAKQIAETEGLLIPLFERVGVSNFDPEIESLFEPEFKQKFDLLLGDIKKEINKLKGE